MNWINYEDFKLEKQYRRVKLNEWLEYMRRNNCKQTKDNNPNWKTKVNLPELDRVEINTTECFLNSGLKVMKFSDKQLLSDGKILGYSCEGLINI